MGIRGYDAWKTSPPPEPPECRKCSSEEEIGLEGKVRCPECQGRGWGKWTGKRVGYTVVEWGECGGCDGTGIITCDRCKGSGEDPCSRGSRRWGASFCQCDECMAEGDRQYDIRREERYRR